jgi:glycosyltransferase involved in cell wall biosynthesis
VAGPAALYFDPRQPAQVAAQVAKLLSDQQLAERLAELGRGRAKDFSWSAAAERTLQSYRRALSG